MKMQIKMKTPNFPGPSQLDLANLRYWTFTDSLNFNLNYKINSWLGIVFYPESKLPQIIYCMEKSDIKDSNDTALTNRTGFVYSEVILKHEPFIEHYETPQRISSIYEHLEKQVLTEQMTRLEIQALSSQDISETHYTCYLSQIEEKLKHQENEVVDDNTYKTRHPSKHPTPRQAPVTP